MCRVRVAGQGYRPNLEVTGYAEDLIVMAEESK